VRGQIVDCAVSQCRHNEHGRCALTEVVIVTRARSSPGGEVTLTSWGADCASYDPK
jgi:hypothetical protein